ncbi:MAG: mandelate racemase/muconate lactonizing enzyme family protein [Limisphaerales bacterium]
MKLSRRKLLIAAGLTAMTRRAYAEDDISRARMRKVLKTSDLREPIIIESIDLLQKDGESFVRVRSRDGTIGISLTNRRPYLHPILKERVIPYFLKKDARQLEEHLFGVYRFRSNYKLQGLALWSPLAWVEFAILDLLGRVAGKPIWNLLGEKQRERVPFCVASGNRNNTPEQEVRYLRKLLDETSGRAVKYRVGGRMSRNADSIPGRTEKPIPLSRNFLGDQVAIHADANSSYDVKNGIRVGRMLEDIKAVYFEEPCPFDKLGETRKVTEELEIPVAGGEQEFSQWRFEHAIRTRVTDVVQPDLQYHGGLIRSKRVANMAAAAGLPTTCHISGGFGFFYMLHFAACTKDIGPWQEYKRGIEKYTDWFTHPIDIRDGALSIPTGPGVGIADPKAVLRGARKV